MEWLRWSLLAALSAGLLAGCAGSGVASPPPAEVPAAPNQALAWTQIAATGPWPEARRNHSLVHAAGHDLLVLFGGRKASTVLADMWVYDLKRSTWTEVRGGGPPGRFGHTAVWDGSRVLLFGGQAGPNFFNDTWAFDPSARRWQETSPDGERPAIRYGVGAAYDTTAGRLYISHGFTFQGRFDDTWGLTGAGPWENVTPSGERPLPRCLHRCLWDADGGRMLLFGGQSNETPNLNDLWAYTPSTRRWARLAPTGPPEPRHFSSWVLDEAGGRGLLFGGQGTATYGDLWALDLKEERWTRLAPQGTGPGPLHSHDAVYDPAGRRMLVFGGFKAGADTAELWELKLP